MNEVLIGYYLIQGLPIPYENINIYQPTLKDINELKFNISEFEQYKFCYCASIEHLNLSKEEYEQNRDKSFFVTLFNIKEKTFIVYLIMSLIFFFRIKEDEIFPDFDNHKINILNKEKNEIIFSLNESNFESFSKIMRLIFHTEKYPVDNGKPKYRLVKYKDPIMQAKFEKMLENMYKQEAKEEEENRLYFSDILGMIINSEYSKYNLFTIANLTIWQIYYTYENMFNIESNNITKSQYCSGQFEFKKQPNLLQWSKQSKIRLPKDMIEN